MVCGDGVVDPNERCDGDCPSECSPPEPLSCTRSVLVGAGCQLRCEVQPIGCLDGDGCCLPGCAEQDSDCAVGPLALDPSFGGGDGFQDHYAEIAQREHPTGHAQWLEIDSQGGLVFGSGSSNAVYKLTPQGERDLSFGDEGRFGSQSIRQLSGLTIDAEDRVLISGTVQPRRVVVRSAGVERYTASGQPDPQWDLESAFFEAPHALATQTVTSKDGRVFQLAYQGEGESLELLVRAHSEDGRLDPSFGEMGVFARFQEPDLRPFWRLRYSDTVDRLFVQISTGFYLRLKADGTQEGPLVELLLDEASEAAGRLRMVRGQLWLTGESQDGVWFSPIPTDPATDVSFSQPVIYLPPHVRNAEAIAVGPRGQIIVGGRTAEGAIVMRLGLDGAPIAESAIIELPSSNRGAFLFRACRFQTEERVVCAGESGSRLLIARFIAR